MSKSLKATTIFYNPKPIGEYFPANTLWCKDEEGEWYYHIGTSGRVHPIDPRWETDPKLWPNILYRNYWWHINVKGSEGAPYYDAIRLAEFITIK